MVKLALPFPAHPFSPGLLGPWIKSTVKREPHHPLDKSGLPSMEPWIEFMVKHKPKDKDDHMMDF
jgi:hypothetical protein